MVVFPLQMMVPLVLNILLILTSIAAGQSLAALGQHISSAASGFWNWLTSIPVPG